MRISGHFRLLAQETTDDRTLSIVYGCVILMVLVVIAALVVNRVRRWVTKTEDMPAGGFSLSDLRALHKSGKISNEEFEKTRAMIVEALKKASEKSEVKPPEKT